jgi:hypothetical protein
VLACGLQSSGETMKRLLFLIVFATFVAGCSTSGSAIKIGDESFSPTDPAEISLLLQPPERKHSVIALVEGVAATDDYFTKPRTEAAAIAAMKEEAARIGAHAIVLTGKGTAPYGQFVISNSSGSAYVAGSSVTATALTTSSTVGWEKYTFSGTAIRYSD